ncbi:MAG: glycosyl hydrolase family 8, partial [Cytophaga sp.]|uniref:glycosyl hydrolase family 8 n=1 Tax=Cytophaga sp. TaxID=29535 RepID=UPI003F8138D8
NPTYASAWNSAVNGAYTMINANADGTTGLISDWCNPSGVRNTCNPGGLGYAATDGYGYDACRNPWRMAQDVIWSNDAQAKALCGKLATYLNGRGAGNVGGPLYQTGGNYSGYAHNATFVATFATAVMGSTNQTLMNAMYTETKNTKDVIKNSTLSGYFGNTLRCVSLFMMTGNYWKPGTTSIQEINVRQATNNVLTGTTYDFQNQQISPPGTGKAITFTIENLGFTSLNLTGTTKVAVSGTDASSFVVTTQPSASTLALGATTTFVVTFNPTTTGTKNAVLTIASNDPDENPYTINVTGIGTLNATAPKMTVYDTVNVLASGSAFPMGSFTTSSVGYKILKITNTGDAPLTISAATFSGTTPPFALLGTAPILPKTIAIGATGYLTVGYNAPATATTSSSTMTLTTTDPNSPSYTLNLTASAVACSASPTNNILDDYDGNINVKLAFQPKGAFSPIAANPSVGGLNLSPTVASYVRPSAGTTTPAWDGKYDIIRYYNCGTVAGTTHATSTYVSFNMTAANPTVQILFFSPAVGVPITLSPQKPDMSTTTGWLPINADYSSNINVTTTKANQWELLTFDLSKIITPTNLTANIKCFDIQIDPLMAYSSLPANAAVSARTFYIDEIKYGINPCVNDLSGILQDFDTHTNTTLDYAVAALSAPVTNPVSGGVNTSANVGQFTKTINTATYDDGFRYDGCGNKIDLSTKKYISMLVYSPIANLPIQISAKVPDGADADTYPDDAVANTQNTVFANTWHRLYFDMSTISAANLPNVFGIDIFFDPTDVSGITSGSKIYFDDIRLESALPCVTGIPATSILNDFENNRYLGVQFPLTTSGTTNYFNTIKANPAPTGINTSSIVGEFLRGTGTSGTSVRFTPCQNKLDLSPGNNIIDMKVYSPNANVAVTMSLKTADGLTTIQNVTDTVKLANTWTNLRFDFTNSLNATNVGSLDVIVDPNAVYSGATSTVAARTYRFDDIRYSLPEPEINIKALTSPTTTDIPNTGAFSMGTAVIGDSTAAINFSIQNNGLQTLTLTGPTYLTLGGANPTDFVITTTQTFSPSIGSFGATGFTVMFKPKGTVAGPRSASITVKSNDTNEGTYVIYLNAIATASKLAVLDGGLTTSPVVANNNSPALNVGASTAGTPAAPYTLSIKNTGNGPLSVTSVLGSAGFVVSALSPASPIAAGAFSTFTVTATPALPGVNNGTITIKSNDPATPTYVVNVSVTGSSATISIEDATSTVVPANNTTPISVGSAPVATAATAYTFTVKNTGTGPLSIGTITPTTGFITSAITPTGAIAAGGSATFTVTGTPAAAGVNTGSITITSNDPATPSYKINVSVTGTTPTLQILDGTTVVTNNNTPAISVGTATVNTAATAYTFTIKNTGAAPLKNILVTGVTGFNVTQPASTTIAAGASATFTVIGTPNSTTVPLTGTITIASNDASSPFKLNVSVTGTAAPTPTLQILDGTTVVANNNTPAISVGSAVVNTAASPYTFTIKNTGTAALTSIVVTGVTGFTVTQPASTTIAAGASATFTVIGTPNSSTVPLTGTITIASNDASSPFKLNVSVTGTAAPTPTLQILNGTTVVTNNNTPAISVGSAVVNTAATAYTFTIKNTGAAPLTNIVVSGVTGFTVTQPAATTIAAGSSATFTVTGTPNSSTVPLTGTITIASNDASTPFKLNVSVTGTAAPTPTLQILDGTTVVANNNAPSISVGSAVVNTAASPYTFTIKNTGAGALTSIVVTGVTGFNVTQPASTTIAAGASATFTVIGTPNSSTVPLTGTITIASNDASSPFKLNVSVTGTAAPTPTLQILDGTTVVANNNTPAISVGSAVVNTAASPYTFTIKNTGAAALTNIVVSGVTGFTVTQPASTTIAAGASATFTVIGTPNSSTVPLAGVITIASNDAASPFKLNVSVTGTAAPTPTLQILDGTTVVANNNAPSISVGSAVVNTAATAYTFTIKNTGAAALTNIVVTGVTGFNVTQPASTTIAAGASATFTVVGTPNSATVPLTGTITIASNDAATPFKLNVSVSGTAAPTPTLQILDGTTVVANNNTPAISVGSAVVNTAATAYTFTIKNTGAAALTNIVVTGVTGFNVTQPASTTIAAGASATFTVVGTPNSSTTPLTGVITIASNDASSPFKLNVSVTGTTAPTATLQILNGTTVVANNNTPAISVGSAVVNTAANPYTFTIKNTGPAALTNIVVSGVTGFNVTQPASTTIAAGSSATFTVTGTPNSTTTPLTGAISIASNDASSPFTLNVSVSGTAAPTAILTIPGITSNATVVDLGSAIQNTATAPITITINNTGSLALNIASITSSNPDFAVTSVSPNPIPAGGTGTFTITATPSTVGTINGTITITSNDPSSPFLINVTAKGIDPLAASLQVLDAPKNDLVVTNGGPNILIGYNAINTAVAPYKFNLKNTGGAPLTISNVIATAGFTATQIFPSGPIAPGQTAYIMVAGTPNSASAPRTGSIMISSNDASSPFMLNVSVEVGTPTGVATALSSTAIDLYPNPASENAYLEFNGNFDNVSVVVYTIDGKAIMSQDAASVFSSQTTKIENVEGLPAGIYLVEVSTTQGKLVKRLIKQ